MYDHYLQLNKQLFKNQTLKRSVFILGRMYGCPLSLKILLLLVGSKNARGCPLSEFMSAQILASDSLIRSLMGVVYFKYPNLTALSCTLSILDKYLL